MAVTSINIVRVSNNLKTLSLLESLRRNTLNLFLEQTRLASGNRINAPSEDPIGAMQAVRLTEVLERQEQVLANIRHADSFLAMTDAGIGEINDLLIEAHAIASEMVNTTADQAQRDSTAELIRGIANQLVTVGNRMYAGVYLFGGQQTTSPPFTQATGGVEYRGDLGALTTRVDYQQNPAYNLTGSELFGALSSRVQGYVDWNPTITRETRLADLKGAAGASVKPSMIRIATTVPPLNFVADLGSANTVGDVLDQINAAASAAGLTTGPGGQFNATLNAAGNGLELSVAGGTVTVGEVGTGVAARDLGILGGGVPVLDGQDLQPRLTLTTRIDSLFGGAGAVLGAIQIRSGDRTVTVDLSGSATVQDVLNKINGAGANVYAHINDAGTGIDVINRVSGVQMYIGEAGGNTAELLGIRSMHAGTPLSRMNDGQGVRTREGMADFRIIAKDGSRVDVNLDGAKTVEDVLNAINAAGAAAGVAVSASLATTGNGIRIVDLTGGAGALSVQRLNASSAIDDLGLNKSADPAAIQLVGDDTNGVRTDSVFSALIDLHDALVMGGESHLQEQAITRAAERVKAFIDSTNRTQGVVGARSKAMTTRLQMTEDAIVSTQALLSEVKDLDYTEAITRFQQAQTALQGNLMTAPRMLQLSLLDFIG